MTVKEKFATLSKHICRSLHVFYEPKVGHNTCNVTYLTRKYFSWWLQISVRSWSIPLLIFINSWCSAANMTMCLLPIILLHVVSWLSSFKYTPKEHFDIDAMTVYDTLFSVLWELFLWELLSLRTIYVIFYLPGVI